MRLRTINEDIALAIDFSQAPNDCEYCGKSAELRPYGRNGAWICFECGMEHEDETDANFADILDGNGNDAVKIVSLEESLNMQTKKVKAKDLKVGDYLPMTQSTVVVAPSAGLKTPRGKVDLTVEFSNGQRQTKTWNKNTDISVQIKDNV